jgi:hypothetical protein
METIKSYILGTPKENTDIMLSIVSSEVKLYAASAGTLIVTTIGSMEDWLKITLLVVTILFTFTKWIFALIDRNKEKNKEQNE